MRFLVDNGPSRRFRLDGPREDRVWRRKKLVRLSSHADQELVRRQVSRSVLDAVLSNPEQIVAEKRGRKVYQSRVDFAGSVYLVRALVDDRIEPAVVIAVYRTSKIAKYWRAP